MRTPDSIREEAAQQFAWGIDFASRRERDGAAAREDEELGMRLVDAALALADGELFDWGAHFPAEMPAEDKLAKSFRVLPFLCGALKLLELEFAHATAGVVPKSVVRDLMGHANTVEYQGIELTAKTVHLQYRRLPLN